MVRAVSSPVQALLFSVHLLLLPVERLPGPVGLLPFPVSLLPLPVSRLTFAPAVRLPPSTRPALSSPRAPSAAPAALRVRCAHAARTAAAFPFRHPASRFLTRLTLVHRTV